MLRFLAAFAVILTFVSSSLAQESVVDTGVGWLKSAWTRAKKEGRPAAERAIRQFPERFKDVPKQVTTMRKQLDRRVKDLKLDERKELLTELWRIRHCLNLMALLDSGVLEQLTGIDNKTLRAAVDQANTLQVRLQGK